MSTSDERQTVSLFVAAKEMRPKVLRDPERESFKALD